MQAGQKRRRRRRRGERRRKRKEEIEREGLLSGICLAWGRLSDGCPLPTLKRAPPTWRGKETEGEGGGKGEG